jgi:arsenite oxidase large subunit
MVKAAIDAVPAGDRARQVDAIMLAIEQGGLFVVDVDIVPTQIGSCAHVMLPAATAGEANLTSMNGERRMRLTERYMDPPGQALPDSLIVARLAQALAASWRSAGKSEIADKFNGYDWKTEEDAFMDGYHRNAAGGQFVTYERLRAMGTNGFQEPAVGFENGKINGTKRLFADGKFNTENGKAKFAATPWRGLATPGKAEEKAKFRFLVNQGRANAVWQSVYLDQDNPFVHDRFPLPYLQMNPGDMKDLGLKEGDLAEVYNENGSTQAMVWPTDTARRGETFMLFAFPSGVVGNVVSKGVNELIIPNYKQTWGDIRKLADRPRALASLSFKSQDYLPPA